jgi:hypothetical protein
MGYPLLGYGYSLGLEAFIRFLEGFERIHGASNSLNFLSSLTMNIGDMDGNINSRLLSQIAVGKKAVTEQ